MTHPITMLGYSQFVASRFKPLPTRIERLLHGAVGVSGEGGELLDAIKKSWVYGKPLDVENVREECGDLMFYIQAICNEFGWTLGELADRNMAKLEKRYPSGYTDAAAIARADKAEAA